MRKIKTIEPTMLPLPKRLKVCAYARVSKDTDRLLHSASTQISNYSKIIQSNHEWEYVGVYSDIGISGLDTKARDGFNDMILACEKGEVDIILTKSISRFARNTVDLLETVRYLKTLDVEVRFERENINSLSSDGELMLSILGSFAQEESVSTSSNVKWAIRKRYENGTIGIRNKKVFGYRLVDDTYEIEATEVEYVKKIFEMYLDNVPILQICKYLKDNGVKTIRGFDFSNNQIKYILKNEIYIGDIRLQKVFIENPLKKTRATNNGQLPGYYMEDCHEPIIDRDTFEKVQEKLKSEYVKPKPKSHFSGKLKCGVCGRNYSRREYPTKVSNFLSENPNATHSCGNLSTTKWHCQSKNKKNGCNESQILSELELEKICSEMLEIEEFNGSVFKIEVDYIEVLENNTLKFNFVNGRVKSIQQH